MEEVHLFPDRSEEIAKAILAISNQMNCNPNLIHACFGRLDMFWSVPEHLSTVADTTHHLNRVSRFAEQLFNAMNSMSSSQQESLIAAGAVTSFQIQHLAALLEQDSALLHKSADGRSFPFPGRTHPTVSVIGMPSAVKPFKTATRTWNSAT